MPRPIFGVITGHERHEITNDTKKIFLKVIRFRVFRVSRVFVRLVFFVFVVVAAPVFCRASHECL
jgi:hypothetical protein